MNPAHDNLARPNPTAPAAGEENVVDFRDGESLAALVDQPLPADAEQLMPEHLSILVQIRRAHFASRAVERIARGWRDPYRWAWLSVALGAVLIVVAGLLESLGR